MFVSRLLVLLSPPCSEFATRKEMEKNNATPRRKGESPKKEEERGQSKVGGPSSHFCGVLLSPLFLLGWCCLAWWCCFLSWVALPSPPSFCGWCCFLPFAILAGGALPPPSFPWPFGWYCLVCSFFLWCCLPLPHSGGADFPVSPGYHQARFSWPEHPSHNASPAHLCLALERERESFSRQLEDIFMNSPSASHLRPSFVRRTFQESWPHRFQSVPKEVVSERQRRLLNSKLSWTRRTYLQKRESDVCVW